MMKLSFLLFSALATTGMAQGAAGTTSHALRGTQDGEVDKFGPLDIPRKLQSCPATRCGTSWSDANNNCGTACASWPNEGWDACPSGQSCYSDLDTSLGCCSTAAGGSGGGGSSSGGGCSATRCGTSWSDAMNNCKTTCAAWPEPGWDACPSGESCYGSLDTTLSCCSSGGSGGGGGGSTGAGGETAYITYHYYYEGQSTNSLACSDGSNGLQQQYGITTLSNSNMLPFVSAISNIVWNSPNCGNCYAVTSSTATVYVTAIDACGPGPSGEAHFDMHPDAFEALLGQPGVAAGSGYANFRQVDDSYCKGNH